MGGDGAEQRKLLHPLGAVYGTVAVVRPHENRRSGWGNECKAPGRHMIGNTDLDDNLAILSIETALKRVQSIF
jgi:hypothetical protein